MIINSLKDNNELKDLVYSSEITKGDYEKFYILKIEENENENELENIPYILKIKGLKDTIRKIDIKIPTIIKYLGVYNNKTEKIYTDSDIYKLLEYEKDLYKINKEINNIKKAIQYLDFSLVDKVLNLIYKLKNIIYEYETSIKVLNDEKLNKIIKNININIKNIQDNIMIRATYLDMKTSRILTIVSLMTFPILLVTAWFGTNFPNDQMKFMNWKYSYISLIIFCILFLIFSLYLFRNDLRILLI